jgi:pyruvate dehydrogenase E1 component alpha subunit
VNQFINEKRFPIPVHLALGHEAIALALSEVKSLNDQLLLNHRNIHYHLALGATLEELVAEYSLQREGLSQGKYGSMNLWASRYGNSYTSNILGNNLAVALGISKAALIKENNTVTWVITGDGAIEEGAFYESLLCAKSWNLPIVIIVENNRWSLGTEIEARRIPIQLEAFANSMHVDYHLLKGNDVLEYIATLGTAKLDALGGRVTIVEVELVTLGGYFIEEAQSKNRYINYHAGTAKINSEYSEYIAADTSDPLYVNQALRVLHG